MEHHDVFRRVEYLFDVVTSQECKFEIVALFVRDVITRRESTMDSSSTSVAT